MLDFIQAALTLIAIICISKWLEHRKRIKQANPSRVEELQDLARLAAKDQRAKGNIDQAELYSEIACFLELAYRVIHNGLRLSQEEHKALQKGLINAQLRPSLELLRNVGDRRELCRAAVLSLASEVRSLHRSVK